MLEVEFKILDMSREQAPSIYENTVKLPTGICLLSPELLWPNIPNEFQAFPLGLQANVSGDNTNLHVSGFLYFAMRAFANDKASIPTIVVEGASERLHFNDLTIGRLDAERSNSIVCDSKIEEFNVGIRESIENNHQTDGVDEAEMHSTDIRGGYIGRLRIFRPQNSINLQLGMVDLFEIQMGANRVDSVRIWQAQNISYLLLDAEIRHLTINEGVVDTFIAAQGGKVGSLSVRSGAIKNAHGVFADTFGTHNLETTKLQISSARNAHDPDLLANAKHQYSSLRNQENRSFFSRIAGMMMNVTCGYGYKPIRPLISACVIWSSFAVLYFTLSITGVGGIVLPEHTHATLLNQIGFSFYFSGIALTTVGFGDVTPIGWIAMTLAGLEGAIGIILFALLVFSLSRRHGDL